MGASSSCCAGGDGTPIVEITDTPEPALILISSSADEKAIAEVKAKAAQAEKDAIDKAAADKAAAEKAAADQNPAEEKQAAEKATADGAAQATAAPAGPTLKIEFIADGATKTVEFANGPLGLTFKNTMPLVVRGLAGDGVSDKAGVQPGWEFSKIGNESLASVNYDKAMSIMSAALKDLPKVAPQQFAADSLVLELSDETSRTWKYCFKNKPLGMSFDNSTPIKVKAIAPDGVAAGLGIKPGMIFVMVGDEVVKDKTYTFIHQAIKDKSNDLPTL